MKIGKFIAIIGLLILFSGTIVLAGWLNTTIAYRCFLIGSLLFFLGLGIMVKKMN